VCRRGGVDSKAVCDQILAVDKKRVLGKAGSLSQKDMKLLEESVSRVLGLQFEILAAEAAQITSLQVKCMQIRLLHTYPGDACATSRAWREAWERGPHWRLGLQRGAAALAAEARAVLARLSGGAVASAPG
jgi:hypothetical protein